MKRLLVALLLIPSLLFATGFTEFYCTNGGSNLNAGSTTGNSAAYTSTNGNWSTVTNIFTPTDGSTPASSVATGDWVSIYLDAATQAVFIARVTNVAAGVNGAITVSSSARAGTPPTTSVTGRSLKAGGAWKGPNGANTTVPLNFAALGSAVNSSTDPFRVNFKNDQTYSITAQISGGTGGGTAPITIQGFTSSAGDGGRAVIDGGTTNAVLLSIVHSGNMVDMEVKNNASAGTAELVNYTSNAGVNILKRCVFHGGRGSGIRLGNGSNLLIECEAYANNRANTSSGSSTSEIAGFSVENTSNLTVFVRCISHDNSGSNAVGWSATSSGHQMALINCIADSNGNDGVKTYNSAGSREYFINSDFYNNGADGISLDIAETAVYIENCNFIKNTGAGINNGIAGGTTSGFVLNCGYGAGTQANGSADTLGELVQTGTVTYASNVTPWKDPANGDWTINLAAAMNAGRGAFFETDSGLSAPNTVGYPDIGAAQHRDTQKGGVFGQ